jgi:hypothetical protein
MLYQLSYVRVRDRIAAPERREAEGLTGETWFLPCLAESAEDEG